jgi:hypothetical protein
MSVVDALRAGLESGDFCALGECYADDAVLDLNVRGGRERITGPAAIVARLQGLFPGPGRLVEWTTAVHDAGATVWLERVSDADGAVLRQRHYLLLREGRVTRQFAYAAPHRTGVAGAGGRPAFDPALIGGLGDITEHTVLASRGWSGNALERVVLADGRVLIAKRDRSGHRLDRPSVRGPGSRGPAVHQRRARPAPAGARSRHDRRRSGRRRLVAGDARRLRRAARRPQHRAARGQSTPAGRGE